MPTYSKTRWWSQWEVMYLMLHFGDIECFINNVELGSTTTHSHLLKILHNSFVNSFIRGSKSEDYVEP